jgi:UDP-glucose 4-epimerase
MTLPHTDLTKIICDFKPNLLIHCAGPASVASSVSDPIHDFRNTVDVCAFILEALRVNAPDCKFILPSSAAVYGNPTTIPIKESTPCRPISPYGYHRWMCELIVEEYRKLFDINAVSLRIFSAYGPGNGRMVVHDLCQKILGGSERLEVYGTGRETRDFIHVSDLMRAMHCVAHSNSYDTYNIGVGEQVEIRTLVNILSKELDSKKPIYYTGANQKGYPTHWEANVDRLRSIGFEQSISFEQGLKDYVQWFLRKRDQAA